MKNDRLARQALHGLPFLTVLAIFLGDVLTPSEVSMAPLAAVPVAVTAWFAAPILPYILCLAVALDATEFVTRAASFQSAAAAAIACIGLALVTRISARGRQTVPAEGPAAPWIGRRSTAMPAPANRQHKALTRRESEVVTLAADGLTAREIGAALFIGERTVETHLANSYAKLGITSKRELVLRKVRSDSA